MTHITFIATLALAVVLVVPSFAAERMTDQQRKAVLKVADDAKKAMLAKDHEMFVGLLHPEMIKAAGGRERMIQMIKAEDAKNDAAGVVIESLDFSASDAMHTGSEFRLTFVTSTLVAKIGATRIQSKSFYVAFSPLRSEPWYLLDGTRLTMQQFRQVFRGFPAELQLPTIEKKTL